MSSKAVIMPLLFKMPVLGLTKKGIEEKLSRDFRKGKTTTVSGKPGQIPQQWKGKVSSAA